MTIISNLPAICAFSGFSISGNCNGFFISSCSKK